MAHQTVNLALVKRRVSSNLTSPTMLPCASRKSLRGFETEIYQTDEHGRVIHGKWLQKHTFMYGWIKELFWVLYFDEENIVVYRAQDEHSQNYNYMFCEYDYDKSSYVTTDRRPEKMKEPLDKPKQTE